MAYLFHKLFIVRRNVELFHMPPKFMFKTNKQKPAIIILAIEFDGRSAQAQIPLPGI